MTVKKQHTLEPFKMSGNMQYAKDMYNELVQWGRSENADNSKLRGCIYGMGYSVCDMPYFGWVGENLEKERDKMYAVINAYRALLSVLEDVIGVESEWYDDDLNEHNQCRYQILDTKGGTK